MRLRQALAQYGPIVLSFVCGLSLLLIVQHAARQVIEQSSATNGAAQEATPLLDLSSADVQFRHAGRETMRLHAARFVLLRDLRTVAVEGISGGVAYSDARPALLFAAGQAAFDAGAGGLSNGWLHLENGVLVKTTALHFPVLVSTSGANWSWPRGEIVSRGPVEARVGSLGYVRSETLEVNPVTRSADFSGVVAVANASILPLPIAATAGGSSSSGPKNVIFDTKSLHWDDQSHTMTTADPVTVREDNVEMQTVGATYDQTTEIAQALAPVKIIDDKNTLVGEHGSINFKTHLATIDGTVEMSATPSAPSGKSQNSLEGQTRKPTQMFCDHIVYNYRTKIAEATGHLRIVQTDRVVTADKGTYDTNAQLIDLAGSVDGRDSDGKHVTASSATISVDPKNEYIDVKGPVEYAFPVTSEDNPLPPAAQSSSSKPAPGQPSPPARTSPSGPPNP